MKSIAKDLGLDYLSLEGVIRRRKYRATANFNGNGYWIVMVTIGAHHGVESKLIREVGVPTAESILDVVIQVDDVIRENAANKVARN